jgi:acyl-coenzyme A thioesterase PaaI-like protein
VKTPHRPELIDDHHCFACGMENAQGLRIEWKVDGDRTTAEYTPEKKYQGWKDIAHGGLIATLLDEAMTRLAWVARGGALTAEMTVRFLKPAPIGRTIHILGEITGENRKLVRMKARLSSDPEGLDVIATSEGTALKMEAQASRDPGRIGRPGF